MEGIETRAAPCVAPDHRIVQGPASVPVPEDGGLPLVGDPHPGQPLQAPLASELLSHGLDTALHRAQQLIRPLLHPAEILLHFFKILFLILTFRVETVAQPQFDAPPPLYLFPTRKP